MNFSAGAAFASRFNPAIRRSQSAAASPANVHGTDPVRDGTFADSVLGVTLFHPALGVLRCSPGWPFARHP